MKNLTRMMIVAGGLTLASTAHAQTTVTFEPVTTTNVSFGVAAGYFNGFGGDAFVIFRNIGDSGIGARAWAGYFVTDGFEDTAVIGTTATGEPLTAGALFKDSLGFTNEFGRIIPLGVDVLFGVLPATAEGLRADAYAGVRYSLFDVTLRNNAGDFTRFSSNQFGIGGGVLASAPVAPNLFVTGDLGINRFFDSAITISSSDPNTPPDTIAPGDPDFAETDAYINQPKTVFTARIGLAYRY